MRNALVEATPAHDRDTFSGAELEPLQSVGHGITAATGRWTFGNGVCRTFDQHIRASVPGYTELQETILKLAERMVAPGAVACDLGCSTGNLTHGLARRCPAARVIGVDLEPQMLSAAKRLAPTRPDYRCADIRGFSLPRCALITSCYTLMFLPLSDRLPLLERIRNSLAPDGAFVLAEKVIRRDPSEQARCRDEHYAFKRAQGLSDAEIRAKAESIRGRLVPLYEDENLDLLERAGFETVRLIARHTCFDAWLAR